LPVEGVDSPSCRQELSLVEVVGEAEHLELELAHVVALRLARLVEAEEVRDAGKL